MSLSLTIAFVLAEELVADTVVVVIDIGGVVAGTAAAAAAEADIDSLEGGTVVEVVRILFVLLVSNTGCLVFIE